MIQAVLLDVFGTLLDENTDEYLSPYSGLLRALRLNSGQRLQAGHMLYTMPFPTIDSFADHLEMTFARGPIPLETRLDAIAELERDMARFSPVDGVFEFLPRLRKAGVKLALVSNLAASYEPLIRQHKIADLVDETIYSFDVGYKKPEPQIFEMALCALRVSADSAVMVGDDEQCDVQGAETAGLRSRLVTSSGQAEGAPLKKVLSSILRGIH